MPKELEEKLQKEARSRGYSGERADRFIYGTMRKTGWKPDREKHGSLNDIVFHENAATCEVVDDGYTHPIHKGYKGGGDSAGLEDMGAITWGALDPPAIDKNSAPQFTKGKQSANRDAGQAVHYGAPVDYFGPDTDYRAEEIDVHQYGRSYDPIPLKDYYKTDDKIYERTFRVMEQDEYDSNPQPGMVTDSQPMSEAYGAVNYRGAGPDKDDGVKAGDCDYRSFESQLKFARTNKDRSTEYAVDVSGLDTHEGKDIK